MVYSLISGIFSASYVVHRTTNLTGIEEHHGFGRTFVCDNLGTCLLVSEMASAEKAGSSLELQSEMLTYNSTQWIYSRTLESVVIRQVTIVEAMEAGESAREISHTRETVRERSVREEIRIKQNCAAAAKNLHKCCASKFVLAATFVEIRPSYATCIRFDPRSRARWCKQISELKAKPKSNPGGLRVIQQVSGM